MNQANMQIKSHRSVAMPGTAFGRMTIGLCRALGARINLQSQGTGAVRSPSAFQLGSRSTAGVGSARANAMVLKVPQLPAAASAQVEIADIITVRSVVPQGARHGTVVGALWIYHYAATNRARRVLRIFDPQVAKRLNVRRALHLPEVAWDPCEGQSGVEKVVQAACTLIGELLAPQDDRNSERRGSHQLNEGPPAAQSTRKRFGPGQPARHGAASAQTAASTSGPEAKDETARQEHKADESGPKVHQAPTAYVRIGSQAEGQVYQGPVVGYGMCERTSDSGPYQSFRVQIETSPGTVVPLYGVELRQEFTTRGVRIGDRVKITCMGKDNSAGGYTRNLYLVEVLEKAT